MELSTTQRRIISIAVGVIGLCLLTSLFFKDRVSQDLSELEPLPAVASNTEAGNLTSITVHVIGAVNAPGVYCLVASARLQDAIVAAGGFTDGADFQALNLAAPLADGIQVVVPYLAAMQSQADVGTQATTAPPVADTGYAPPVQTEYMAQPVEGAREMATTATQAPAHQPAAQGMPTSQATATPVPAVPIRNASATPATRRPQTRAQQTVKAPQVPVNLNRATQQELETLPEVGPALAGRIVAYRMQNGSFRRLEDLMAVQGIGQKTLAQIAPYVTL